VYPGAHAVTTPDKPAVIMAGTGETVTYRELDDRSMRLAQLLHDRGLRRGDNIALLAENHPRYHEVFWAAIRSGLYLTAINRYLSAEEVAYLVNDSESKVLIATHALADTAVATLPLLHSCPDRFMMDGVVAGFESYEDTVADQPAEPLAEQPRGDVMLYSSGTTGRPKGIKRPLRDLRVDDPAAAGMSNMLVFMLGMEVDGVYLSPAPLYHAAPLMWSAGVHELGGTVVVMEKFEELTFLDAVERYGVTHSQVVPTMLVRLLKLPEEDRTRFDTSSLQAVVHAAAPCPIEIKRRTIEWLGPIVSEYYAGTEGNGATFITAEDWLAHPGSVGKALVGTIHICDDTGTELPAGEVGLVYFEQETMPFEYHGDEAKTRSAQHPDHPNWSALGDIGYVDDEGYLYLTDRKAFMIISGGVNIYPAEVEECLIVHPKVADVAVFGLPDPEMGEFVQAVVQPAPGVEAGEALAEELREHARAHLARFKVPRVIDFRDELPRHPTGKLYKRLLRDDYVGDAPAPSGG
jgi:acyl-CoA synthetase (AMP-forming)/AMP-acid ligase II